jgi:hypothetical protein
MKRIAADGASIAVLKPIGDLTGEIPEALEFRFFVKGLKFLEKNKGIDVALLGGDGVIRGFAPRVAKFFLLLDFEGIGVLRV